MNSVALAKRGSRGSEKKEKHEEEEKKRCVGDDGGATEKAGNVGGTREGRIYRKRILR